MAIATTVDPLIIDIITISIFFSLTRTYFVFCCYSLSLCVRGFLVAFLQIEWRKKKHLYLFLNKSTIYEFARYYHSLLCALCAILLYHFDSAVCFCICTVAAAAAAHSVFFFPVHCIFFHVRSNSFRYMKFATVRIIVIFTAINNLLLYYVWLFGKVVN